MKAYQKVLKNTSWVSLILGLLTGAYFGITRLDKAEAARDAQVSWCLENGGRTVTIDNISDCFALTAVPIDTGMFGNPRNECRTNPANVWIRTPGGGEWSCYSFNRLVRVVPEN